MNTIRYGIVSPTATYWNLYVAQHERCYADQNLAVEPVLTGSTAATIQQLVDERIELAGCSPDELFSAVQRGADLVVIGGIVNRPVSWIVGQPGLTQIEELRGKRIGVNQTRGSVAIVLRAALEQSGLKPSDYEQVAIGTSRDTAAALKQRRIDAAMLTAPFDLELIRSGFQPLLNVGALFPSYAFTTINARRRWVLEHEAECAAFFRATRAAGDLLADPRRRQPSIAALAAATELNGEVLQQTYEAYLQPGVLSRHGTVSLAGLQAVLAHMDRQDLLTEPAPHAEDVLLPRWIES